MKPSDRVIRSQSQEPAGAKVLLVQGDSVLIEYDEGGQGWWPHGLLTLVNNSDWSRFKAALLPDHLAPEGLSASVNQSIAQTLSVLPVAVLGLVSGLARAEGGDCAEFAGSWQAVCAVSPPTVAALNGLVWLAVSCNLPPAFVECLTPAPHAVPD